MAAACELLGRRRGLRARRAAVRRRVDRRSRHGPHRRGAGRLPRRPTRCCWPRWAGRSGTPRWRRTPPRRGPSRGCSACARSWACSPTCARCGRARRCWTPARSSASGSRAPTCWWCASSPAASTSASRGRDGRHRARRLRLQRPRDRANRARGLHVEPQPGHQRRQGQRPGDLSAVARDGHPRGRGGVPGRAARPPAGGQRRHAAGVAPRGLRRDRHREPVRRHPQRRGRDAHRLARDAAQRVRGRRRARACSSRCTARRPTSPAPGRPTRWPCSARWRSCCATDSAWRTPPLA